MKPRNLPNTRSFNLEEFPKYSLHEINKSREKVLRAVDDFELRGKRLVGDKVHKVCARVERTLIRRKGDYDNTFHENDPDWLDVQDEIHDLYRKRIDALIEISREYSEEPLEGTYLSNYCTAIAGWVEEARLGIPFMQWDGTYPVWAPIYVRDCSRMYLPRQSKKMYQLTLVSAYGPTAGKVWQPVRSESFLRGRLREIGIPKFEKHNGDDIGGMWYTAMLLNKGRGVIFDHINVSSSQATYNKKLYKARQQGCTGAFPNFKNKACQSCPVGRKKCPLSRIDEGYDIIRQCGDHKGYFRDLSSPLCFACVQNPPRRNK